MKTKIVELNGKRYDAVTGKLLGSAPAPTGNLVKPSMDIIAPTNGVRRITTPQQMRISAKTTTPQSKIIDIHRGKPQNLVAHQPQHAKTLMRKAVQRPSESFKRHVKVASHTGALIKSPQITVVPKRAAVTVDEQRQLRAKRIHPSQLVHHFNPAVPVHTKTTIARQAPLATPARTQQPISLQKKITPVLTTKSNYKQPSADIFERALAQATSHRQPPIKPPVKSHRLRTVLSVVACSAAVLAIIGFVGYQHATDIQLRLASSRAGIHAVLPAWRPNGFSVASLASAPGSVTIRFQNAQASQDFSIVQAVSSWNSDALLNNYVLPNTKASYETIQSGGNTIYTYGNNNATWVTGGMWYRLITNGSLSTSQIVQLVANM